MHRTHSVGLALLLALTAVAHAAAADASATPAAITRVQSIKDVAYFDGKDADPVKHKLDLYLPRDGKDYPVLLFIHGGAWRRGDKNGHFGVYSALGNQLARQGIGVAVANYRLSPQVKHPEHIRDVARAFAWVHKNIGKHGGDVSRLFVAGHSAGGHLAALLATDESYLKTHGLGARAIRGVVSLSGVYFLPEQTFANVFGDDPAIHKNAWPMEHVKPGLPPFLLLCADKDLPGCDKAPADRFCTALRAKNNRAELIEARDSTHYQIMVSAALPDDPVARAMLDFLRTHSTRKP